MNRHVDYPRAAKQRKRIASAAARLVAENGISDFAVAKRKAAKSLGLPETTPLPENAAIESELSVYRALFQPDEQSEQIDYLRHKAREIMLILQRFKPYLTGSVLEGTAGRYPEIDVQLFADSAKDVEVFLLNRHIPFAHTTPRNERAEAVLSILDEEASINLIIYPPHEERVTIRSRDGRVRRRAHLDKLIKLLNSNGKETP